jgi:nickel superoxide dismutase
MKTNTLTLASTLTVIMLFAGLYTGAPRTADAHCQVPCGIYDESARITQMHEDAATVAKAVKLMNELAAKDDAQSKQQFVRWTNTKEQHAERIIRTVCDYFLAQKIKPITADAEGYDAYLKRLADHHAVMVAAMKAKQNATPEAAAALSESIDAMEHHWVHGDAH